MTPKELLNPRYVVLEDFPKSPFMVGQVLEYSDANPEGEIYVECNSPKYSDYPAIFKLLHWSERRGQGDMPKYVQRCDYPAIVKEVDSWLSDGSGFYYGEGKVITSSIGYLPISEEEYLEKRRKGYSL